MSAEDSHHRWFDSWEAGIWTKRLERTDVVVTLNADDTGVYPATRMRKSFVARPIAK